MKQISELQAILGDFLGLNKPRLQCFTKMLLALFAVRTVNLRELAVAFQGDALLDSRYKRIKRFFSRVPLDLSRLAKVLFQLFFNPQHKLYLTIDRTNWFWGKAKINLLTLGIAYEGVAIPLYWHLLDKAGNASAQEHIAIVDKLLQIVDIKHFAGLLGDREFASGELFQWCNDRRLPFYIRIKDNAQACIRDKKFRSAKQLFNDLKPKQHKLFDMSVWVFGQKVYLAGSRSERGELMVVATNQSPKNAIAIYLRRWEIECLFQSLKNRGFRFEETHLTKAERIERLMVLLAIGFAWAHKVGEWVATKKPIRFNQHRTCQRPQYSFFRYGLDKLRELILAQQFFKKQFRSYLDLLRLDKVRHFLSSEPGSTLGTITQKPQEAA